MHWKHNAELEAARRGVGSEQALQKLQALNEQVQKNKSSAGISGGTHRALSVIT